MMTSSELENLEEDYQSKISEKTNEHDKAAQNENQVRSKTVKAGNGIWRENMSLECNEKLRELVKGKKAEERLDNSDEEEVVNRPNRAKVKSKSRKRKSQARNTRMVRGSAIGPTNIKRPSNEVSWSSPESKKKRMISPLR